MLMKNMISFFSFGIEHNDGTLPSMRDRVGEDIDDDHSGNNQDQPDDGSQVEVLFENEKAPFSRRTSPNYKPITSVVCPMGESPPDGLRGNRYLL